MVQVTQNNLKLLVFRVQLGISWNCGTLHVKIITTCAIDDIVLLRIICNIRNSELDIDFIIWQGFRKSTDWDIRQNWT